VKEVHQLNNIPAILFSCQLALSMLPRLLVEQSDSKLFASQHCLVGRRRRRPSLLSVELKLKNNDVVCFL